MDGGLVSLISRSIDYLTGASQAQRLTGSHLPCGELRRARTGPVPIQPSTSQFWLESLVMAANKPVVVSGESLLLLAFVVLFVWAVVKLVVSLSR